MRLLLDQNFPRPPGFDLSTVDSTVEAIHVYDHDRGLTEAGTPDWLIYLRAAQDGFDALVTRDWHQREQPEELWVLSNLMLTVVSWRRPFSDPVAEWGHLLAYLPQLKRRIERRRPRVLLLPPPHLGAGNEINPREALGEYATQQARAVQEVRQEAKVFVTAYLESTGRRELLQLVDRG
ncbi:MAG: hypothetical protein ACRDV9_12510 [Acidimicrobiia bacterium]